MPVAELKRIDVEREGLRILDGVDLLVDSGQAIGVVGPNGSGKTTLVRTLATLNPASGGEVVLFDGLAHDKARKRIGMIGHRPYLHPHLSLAENVHHIARLGGMSIERADHAIDVVGLQGARDRRASAASFGMIRRVEIAHQLVGKPDLLLLDEAISGLDELAQELVASLISLTTARLGGVVVVSHDRGYLEAHCDGVLSLRDGRLES